MNEIPTELGVWPKTRPFTQRLHQKHEPFWTDRVGTESRQSYESRTSRRVPSLASAGSRRRPGHQRKPRRSEHRRWRLLAACLVGKHWPSHRHEEHAARRRDRTCENFAAKKGRKRASLCHAKGGQCLEPRHKRNPVGNHSACSLNPEEARPCSPAPP